MWGVGIEGVLWCGGNGRDIDEMVRDWGGIGDACGVGSLGR